MHELSVCLALVAKVERIAASRRAAGVARILVDLGPLAGVEAGLMRNAWPLAAAGSVAAGADLEIRPTSIVVGCTACGRESPAAPNRLLCGHCGDYRTRIVSGDEMILASLELEGARKAGDTPLPPEPDEVQTLQ